MGFTILLLFICLLLATTFAQYSSLVNLTIVTNPSANSSCLTNSTLFCDQSGLCVNASSTNLTTICNGNGLCVTGPDNNFTEQCLCDRSYAGDNCSYLRKRKSFAFGIAWVCVVGGCGGDRLYLGYTNWFIARFILGMAGIPIACLVICFAACSKVSRGGRSVFVYILGIIAGCCALASIILWIRDMTFIGWGWLPDANGVPLKDWDV